jgi:hypothetical protein
LAAALATADRAVVDALRAIERRLGWALTPACLQKSLPGTARADLKVRTLDQRK